MRRYGVARAWALGLLMTAGVCALSCEDTQVAERDAMNRDSGVGSSGHNALAQTSEEPAGDHCAAGGVRIDVGLDLDDDGVLSNDEINATSYACNGQDGLIGQPGDRGPSGDAGPAGEPGAKGVDASVVFEALVTITPESIGEICDAGGQRIDVGIDDGEGDGIAEDGVLHEDEIDDTQYVCDGFGGPDIPRVIVGDYTIENSLDMAVLDGVTEITGSLYVSFSSLKVLSLPDLVDIGGTLQIDTNDLLMTVSLPSLQSVGKQIVVFENDGSLFLGGNPVLTTIDLHALTHVENLHVTNNSLLTTTAWLSALETIGDILDVSGPMLTDLSLPALVSVGSGSIGSCDHSGQICDGVLTTISLPELTSLSDLEIEAENLETLSLPSLMEMGRIGIRNNAALHTVTLSDLGTVEEELTITNNALLDTLDLTSFTSIEGANTTLVIAENPSLPQCIVDAIAAQISPAPTTSYTCCNLASCPF